MLFPNKLYIGSASDLNGRKLRHYRDLRLNQHPNRKLQNHYNKYGKDDLIFIVIDPCFPAFLVTREQFYIDKYKPWFNVCKKAGSSLGRPCTEETKNKMRGKIPWNKGKKLPPMSEITRDRMSKSRLGRKSCWKGKKLSEEHKTNMSKAQIKINNKPPSWLNKHHSDETKNKLSQLRMGSNNPMFGKKPHNFGKRTIKSDTNEK